MAAQAEPRIEWVCTLQDKASLLRESGDGVEREWLCGRTDDGVTQ